MSADLAVLYEHPDWQRPLFEVLDERGADYEAVDLEAGAFPTDDPPGAPVAFNQASPSAYTRGNQRAVPFTLALLRHLERLPGRVVNGAGAFELELSKAAQLALLDQLGVDHPDTIVFNDAEALRARADRLDWPALLKPDQGGSGARMRRVEDPDHLVELLDAEPAASAINTSDDGQLLTDPDNPSEGYYWRLNDDHKIYYYPSNDTQVDKGEIDVLLSTASTCTKSELRDGGCEDQTDHCYWNDGNGRAWWEPSSDGDYERTDFVYGRCAAIRVWKNDLGQVRAYSRGAIRATYKTDDPDCDTCEDEIQGTWNFSVQVNWTNDEVGKIGDTVLDRSESEHADSKILGNAIYADFVWGALGPEALSEEAPPGATGFEISTYLVNDFNKKEIATIDCDSCLP